MAISDWKRRFFGGGSDGERQFLKDCYDAGITAADLLAVVTNDAGHWKIGEETLAVATEAITFSSIPSEYKTLVIDGLVRTDNAATTGSASVSFNGDTTDGNYAVQYVQATNTTVTGSQTMATTGARLALLTSAANSTAGDFSQFRIVIPNYSSVVNSKTAHITQSSPTTRSSGGLFVSSRAFHWRSTAPITTVTLAGNAALQLVAGSTVAVYGLKSGE